MTTPDSIRNAPYATFTGAVFDCNKTDSTFDLNANQYTSFYKAQRHMSSIRVRAHFDDSKYKKNKPMPSKNTYVCVEGFVVQFDTDPTTGHANLIHIIVDNVSFLGRAATPASGTQGESHMHAA